MKIWIKDSARHAVPYAIYLISYFLFYLFFLFFKSQKISQESDEFLILFLYGSSIGAVIAFWRFSMSFAPNPSFNERYAGYIEVPSQSEPQELTNLILSYSRQLRRVALSYEKQRKNLTMVGVTVGVASLAVPIATWGVILSDAFSRAETMPNAWLLVVSSTTSGALGLAIAVALLRHLKNNQKPLAEISNRLMLCMETNMAINATDASEVLKSQAFESALEAFVQPPSLAGLSQSEIHAEKESEVDKRFVASLISALKMMDGK